MMREITVAVDFISHVMARAMNSDEVATFKKNLVDLLSEKFTSHWDPSRPIYGNAYRSIMFASTYIDPIILRAVHNTNIMIDHKWTPSDLTVWIDPNEVSYRIGDSGSIATLPLPALDSAPLSPSLCTISADTSTFSKPKTSSYSRRIEVH